MKRCEICAAVENSRSNNREIWNTPLFQNDTFIVLPSVGPLVEGQVIIASKTHSINLFSMPESAILDLHPILDQSKKILGNDILFAEHGTFMDQKGGSCIDHTHVHVLPGFSKYFDVLDNILPVATKTSNPFLTDISKKKIDFPYILAFSLEDKFRLYQAYNVPSQMIRKAICIHEGTGYGDWKTDIRLDLISKTISIWNKN